jgi:DNA-binding NarL/FixJ family response regulator
MQILLIEDDAEKLRHIFEFLSESFPGSKIDVAKSFDSGLRMVISEATAIDVVLLDMSMPTYDISLREPTGGVPESFAGRELLAQMKLRSIQTPTIVVTMFDSFGEKPNRISIEQLKADLKERFSPPYRDLVYYNSRQEGWRDALKESISRLVTK